MHAMGHTNSFNMLCSEMYILCIMGKHAFRFFSDEEMLTVETAQSEECSGNFRRCPCPSTCFLRCP